MRKPLFGIFLLAVVGISAWRYLVPAPAPKSPIDRMKAALPVEKISYKSSPSKTVAREAPPSPKEDIVRMKMEERFTDLKEEGRRIRDTLMASDPKAAQAMGNMIKRPEYREILDRRHKIEAAWPSASEGEREGMLAEMNSLRQQGVGMLMMEIQQMNGQPLAAPASAIKGAPEVTTAPAAPAAEPAPPPFIQ
jgi:hypothetical protein